MHIWPQLASNVFHLREHSNFFPSLMEKNGFHINSTQVRVQNIPYFRLKWSKSISCQNGSLVIYMYKGEPPSLGWSRNHYLSDYNKQWTRIDVTSKILWQDNSSPRNLPSVSEIRSNTEVYYSDWRSSQNGFPQCLFFDLQSHNYNVFYAISVMIIFVTPPRSTFRNLWVCIRIARSPHHKQPFVLRKMLLVKLKYRTACRLVEKRIFTNSKVVTSCLNFREILKHNRVMQLLSIIFSIYLFLLQTRHNNHSNG